MKRIPFEQVEAQLEILYSADIDINNVDMVSKHCEDIDSFIEACGWTIDEYVRQMLAEFMPLDLSKMN